jgi:predicted small lipoprotein YifL
MCYAASGEEPLVRDRFRVPLTTAAIVAAALALAACGRAGPLEMPPGPAPAPSAIATDPSLLPPGTPENNGQKTGFDSNGNPVAPVGQKRPFVLDPLLR